MTRIIRPSILAAFAVIVLSGCSQYASVREKRPQFRPLRSTTAALVAAEQRIVGALTRERRDPLAALGEYLDAAATAERQLERNPNDVEVRDAYNFAVARVIGTIKRAKLDPWTQPLRVPAAGGEFVLTCKPDPRPAWNPKLYDFTPADQFDVKGTYVAEHTRKDGVGAPLVAVSREPNKNAVRDFTIPRICYGVTAIIRFEGRRAVIAFEDPLDKERVSLDGRSFPLAADFTVPLAVMLASTDTKKLELARLLRPEKFAETARIFRLQPYDPNKTVVLVIHGLMDSPATWTPLINKLRGDEQIRRNYQFWFYSYPSGYPYPYSASILRQELDAVRKRFPIHKPMVVIGHSMGGCISRLLITDTGDKVWIDAFNKPPEQVPLSPESRKLLTEALIFQHRSEVGRVVFMAAPLRGAEMAGSWVGRLGSKLVKTPSKLLQVGRDALKIATFQGSELKLNRIPNSVDTLAPSNRFVISINKIPITRGIPYHTIVGDRGKGGNKDQTKPMMTDGFVPYWSSRLDGAKSELIVPSNHSVHQNPQAIEEVKRILKSNAR
jgi:pimeloyl-ACP methyl ester carboxylesterase